MNWNGGDEDKEVLKTKVLENSKVRGDKTTMTDLFGYLQIAINRRGDETLYYLSPMSIYAVVSVDLSLEANRMHSLLELLLSSLQLRFVPFCSWWFVWYEWKSHLR